ncbi:oxidoreductase [Trichodelitschia bisporula]|uniref:Oxidoreductase n=1 Tax=Trichodelitschia bisporula TaxID=703511 RepID=A0A6G1I8P7_9PEZI|nr:oxidoreductase [Trichodelitschia bisporula]
MAFAQEGCPCVAITDINAVKLEAMRLEILNNTGTDVTVLTAAGDISDERFVNALVKTIVEQTTRIDYLVNCAGVMGHSEITTNTLASQFDRINDINYRGSWLVTRAVLRVMIQQAPLSETTANNAHKPPQRGSIVNIAAQFGLVGRPRSTAYSASNAAIIAMTKGDAIDYSPWGIRINCVCPGFIDTPMVRGNPAANSALKPTIESKVPMRRIGLPEEVAWCVLFLCSNKASFVQGASLPVDGGFTAM